MVIIMVMVNMVSIMVMGNVTVMAMAMESIA